MAHFDIPLDLPHAGRLAQRIVTMIERHVEEYGLEAGDLLDAAEGLSNFLFRFTTDPDDDNPPGANEIRNEAAELARTLVDEMERAGVTSDRMGQYVRNLFECLELGKEGSEISLRAGENASSLQRPV
jgi:hypothetical protein